MKILVCYDASPVAESALMKAISMAKNLNAEMHIFNSISSNKNSKQVFEFIKNDDEIEIEKREAYLTTAQTLVTDSGLPCNVHISNKGKPTGEDIVDFAHELCADYLVIGVRKRLKLEKIIFGSNVQHVVLHSPCPVVAISE